MKQASRIHTLILFCIVAGGLMAFFYVQSNASLQLTVGVITSITYVLWGIIHHAIQKDLYSKVVIEYVLMAAIAIVLLATVLKG